MSRYLQRERPGSLDNSPAVKAQTGVAPPRVLRVYEDHRAVASKDTPQMIPARSPPHASPRSGRWRA